MANTSATWMASTSDGRLELFARGLDESLWHIWQVAPGQGWSSWLSHGKPPGVNRIDAL